MKTLWSVFGKRLEQLIEEEQEIERSLASANTEWHIQNLTREKKRIVKMREELSPTLKSLAKKDKEKWLINAKAFMTEEDQVTWKKEVNASINGIYCGYDIASAMVILEDLWLNCDMDRAVYLLRRAGHLPNGYERVRELMLQYSNMGPEFYEASKRGPLTRKQEERLQQIRSTKRTLMVPQKILRITPPKNKRG